MLCPTSVILPTVIPIHGFSFKWTALFVFMYDAVRAHVKFRLLTYLIRVSSFITGSQSLEFNQRVFPSESRIS